MNWRFTKSVNNEQIIISILEDEVRLFLIKNSTSGILLVDSHTQNYKGIDSIDAICSNWISKINKKAINCSWLLSRSHYKTISVSPPNVANSEIDSSIKWLIKDQVEQPITELLVSHYQPYFREESSSKLTAVIVEKKLIETIVNTSNKSQLNLISIEISELVSAHAIEPYLKQEKITGFIDQDNEGLIYNFYTGNKLTFTRHIKNKFFPSENDHSFTLESENPQDSVNTFLLETQRTLDYCISQVFRRAVDSLVIEQSKAHFSNIKILLEEITELPVHILDFKVLTVPKNTVSPINLNAPELGLILKSNNKTKPIIDFYLQQFKPKPLEFDFKFSVAITIIMSFVFTIFGIIADNKSDILKRHLTQKSKHLNSVQKTVKHLNLKNNNTIKVDDIDQKIITKQNQLINLKGLLTTISVKPNRQLIHYSSILEKLSLQSVESLWLKSINLTPTTISLGGSTTNPKIIPIYIKKITQSQALNSQFENLILKRDKKQLSIINFNISNGSYDDAD